MPLESATYFADLVSSNPAGTDVESQGDDHLRLIKAAAQATFPNAARIFRFMDTKAVQTTSYQASETADLHKLIPFDATSASLGLGLPGTTIDGWWCLVVKRDSSANTVSIDPSGSTTINGSLAITLSKQYQSALCWYDAQAAVWTALIGFPFTPYYSGGQDIPFSDIAPSANAKRILGAATATDFSEQTIATVLEWIGTPARGDILLRGASAFALKNLGASGTFLKSDGTDLVYGLPLVPAVSYAELATYTDISVLIPYDDTVPQIGEGTDLFGSVTITPIKATSRIRVNVGVQGFNGAAGVWTAALFKDGAASAVRTSVIHSTTQHAVNSLAYEFLPASLSAITFTVRAGPNTGHLYLNGTNSTRELGGSQAATIQVTEIFTA